jgi:hypothetical protein
MLLCAPLAAGLGFFELAFEAFLGSAAESNEKPDQN